MFLIKLTTVLACLVSNSRSLPAEVANFNGINEFSLRLLDNIAADNDENFVVSTVSVWNLFALLAEGASGNTFDELMLQLNLPKNPKLTRSVYTAAGEILSTNNTQVTLQRVGSMFIDNSLPVHKEFSTLAKTDYKTNVREVNAKNPEELAKDINFSVCEATNGRIRNAVRSEQLENLRMVLIDAILFKAQWTQAFDGQDTKQEDFYDVHMRKVGTVNMMYQKARHSLVYVDAISAHALELTYGPDRRFSMIILLPNKGTPLKPLIKKLSAYPLKDLSENLSKDNGGSEVDCFVPRFKISSDLDLKQPLKYLGINDVFEDSRASLPGISSSTLYVSKALQKAEIEVTEEGTEAAAATVVDLEDRILGPRVEVNRPFVYIIRERESNLVLFAGVYNTPSVF